MIAIVSDNSKVLLEKLEALFKTRLDFALLSPKLAPSTLSDCLRRLEPKVIFSDYELELAGEAKKTLSSVPLSEMSQCLAEKGGAENSKVVFFTSGSEGTPKLIEHSRESLTEAALASNRATGFSSGKLWLISLPLCHLGGFSILVRAICSGGQTSLSKNSELLTKLRELSPEYLSLVPSQLGEIVDKDFPRPHLILVGGAPLPENLRREARSRFLPVVETWGMTEAGSTIGFFNEDKELLALDNITLKRNEAEGSVSIKSSNVFLGSSSWFNTKDCFELTSDFRLKIIGRSNRMLISGGENIYPSEIERLAERCSGVREVSVVGVSSEKWGQRPVLFYVGDGVDEKELRAILENGLEAFKVPDLSIRLESIPKTENSKVAWRVLESLALEYL